MEKIFKELMENNAKAVMLMEEIIIMRKELGELKKENEDLKGKLDHLLSECDIDEFENEYRYKDK